MKRNNSLPALDSERGRGHGLADIKGKDPMDRRVEVEKQERYAEELRAQMASNSQRRTRPHDDGSSTASPFITRHNSPFINRSGGDSPFINRSGGESLVIDDHPSYPPSPYPLGPPGGFSSRGPATPLLNGDANRATSEKVAQVQESMRQRLQFLHEEQQRQWQKIQQSLQDQVGTTKNVIDQSVERHVETQVRPVMDELAAARRERETQMLRVNCLTDDLASLHREVERLHAEIVGQNGQVVALEGEVGRLRSCHEECARWREQTQRELRNFGDSMGQLRGDQDGLSNRLADALRTLGQHQVDIDHLKRAHEDCARFRTEMQQERRAANDALAQLRSNQEHLAKQLEGVPGLIKQMRDEVTRIAERAARDMCERMRPEPAASPILPPPAPVTIIMPEVSEQAYAVLRNSEGELYELPDLRNCVGRNASCNAVITTSQAISNRHASVDFDSDGRANIRDLGSRNGTFLNERRVPQDAGLVIESGDSIQLGVDGPTYVFEFGPAYYARWPSEPVRVRDGARRSSPAPGRGGRRPGAGSR